MRKIIFLLALLYPAMSFAQKKNDPSRDIQAVKAVIEKETKAFFEINQKAWEDSWAHVPYAYWSFADTTDVNYFAGWENIRQGFADYFRTSRPSTATIERQWLDVKINGTMAYVRFTQRIQDNVRRDHQAEVRVLEKINGAWKIIHVGVIAVQKHERLTTASNN